MAAKISCLTGIWLCLCVSVLEFLSFQLPLNRVTFLFCVSSAQKSVIQIAKTCFQSKRNNKNSALTVNGTQYCIIILYSLSCTHTHTHTLTHFISPHQTQTSRKISKFYCCCCLIRFEKLQKKVVARKEKDKEN